MVELVYKFDKKSYRDCLKRGELIANVQFKLLFLVHKHIYIYIYIYIYIFESAVALFM